MTRTFGQRKKTPIATPLCRCARCAGHGSQKLTFERRAIENGSPLGDGSAIIYVDCTVWDGTPLGKLGHDLMCSDPGDMFHPLLAGCAREAKDRMETKDGMRFKTLQEWVDGAYEEGEAYGRAEGMVEGKLEGKIEGKAEGRADVVSRILESGLLGAGEIAEATGIPLAEVEAMADPAVA